VIDTKVLRALFVSGCVLVATAACGAAGGSTGGSDTPTLATAPPAESATGAPTGSAAVPAPVVEQLTIPARALADNMLGDPAQLEVAIQLPGSYATSDRRYPVVYYLPGYGEPASVAAIGPALQELVEAGAAPEIIVVAVSGVNALGGSFYVDSPVTGAWARAVHLDLVEAIDSRYRTVDDRDARGIAGFSMGGFGALDLAMRHAQVFGAVYALSPGLFAPAGLAESQMFADPETIAGFLEGRRELSTLPSDAATAELVRAMGSSADVRFATAYGAAFSPDAAAGPPYVEYPYRSASGPVDPEVWARWEAGFGGIAEEIRVFADELRSLRGILVEVGAADQYAWIPDGCEHFAEQAMLHDVPVQLEVYEGGHGPITVRAQSSMWPFFAAHLTTS
jgi:S-formylglutathione hydrolase FrmB